MAIIRRGLGPRRDQQYRSAKAEMAPKAPNELMNVVQVSQNVFHPVLKATQGSKWADLVEILPNIKRVYETTFNQQTFIAIIILERKWTST